MGTSATITTRSQYVGDITFYSHWDGYEIAGVLARALDRGRDRWDDPSYANRIIFSQMLNELGGKTPLDETTGFGISSKPSYNPEGDYAADVFYDSLEVEYGGDKEPVKLSFGDFVDRFKGN